MYTHEKITEHSVFTGLEYCQEECGVCELLIKEWKILGHEMLHLS